MADKSNDPVAMWQNMLGEMEKGFNSFANQAMTSPEFSKVVNQVGGVTAGAQKQLGELMEKYLVGMNLPSRAQMVSMAERLQSIEGQLNEIKALLHQVHNNSAAPAGGYPAAPRPPRTRSGSGCARSSTGASPQPASDLAQPLGDARGAEHAAVEQQRVGPAGRRRAAQEGGDVARDGRVAARTAGRTRPGRCARRGAAARRRPPREEAVEHDALDLVAAQLDRARAADERATARRAASTRALSGRIGGEQLLLGGAAALDQLRQLRRPTGGRRRRRGRAAPRPGARARGPCCRRRASGGGRPRCARAAARPRCRVDAASG